MLIAKKEALIQNHFYYYKKFVWSRCTLQKVGWISFAYHVAEVAHHVGYFLDVIVHLVLARVVRHSARMFSPFFSFRFNFSLYKVQAQKALWFLFRVIWFLEKVLLLKLFTQKHSKLSLSHESRTAKVQRKVTHWNWKSSVFFIKKWNACFFI